MMEVLVHLHNAMQSLGRSSLWGRGWKVSGKPEKMIQHTLFGTPGSGRENIATFSVPQTLLWILAACFHAVHMMSEG